MPAPAAFAAEVDPFPSLLILHLDADDLRRSET
jgi:hypothetical protein